MVREGRAQWGTELRPWLIFIKGDWPSKLCLRTHRHPCVLHLTGCLLLRPIGAIRGTPLPWHTPLWCRLFPPLLFPVPRASSSAARLGQGDGDKIEPTRLEKHRGSGWEHVSNGEASAAGVAGGAASSTTLRTAVRPPCQQERQMEAAVSGVEPLSVTRMLCSTSSLSWLLNRRRTSSQCSRAFSVCLQETALNGGCRWTMPRLSGVRGCCFFVLLLKVV